jgi:predicted transposase/invertase (TIGR01784 family)
LEPAIEKAENKLEYLSSDETAMSIYRERERSLHERANMINSAEQRGVEKGIEEGKKEIAKNLLDVLEDETIALKTGLDIKEIKKLRKES